MINTMTMSVAERTREIGIKRAIGASRGRIMRELISEAAVIGLTGGLIGLAGRSRVSCTGPINSAKRPGRCYFC